MESLPAVADKENWSVAYDSDEGTLFYSPDIIPDNSELHQVSDEYSIYVDKKSFAPRGLTIEYFRENYLEHHKELKEYADKLFVDNREMIIKVRGASDTTKAFTATLERDLILEAARGLGLKNSLKPNLAD